MSFRRNYTKTKIDEFIQHLRNRVQEFQERRDQYNVAKFEVTHFDFIIRYISGELNCLIMSCTNHLKLGDSITEFDKYINGTMLNNIKFNKFTEPIQITYHIMYS